jgi:hypothetical protein
MPAPYASFRRLVATAAFLAAVCGFHAANLLPWPRTACAEDEEAEEARPFERAPDPASAPGADADLYAEGCELQAKGQFRAARKRFWKLIDLYPNSPYRSEAEDRSGDRDGGNAFLGFTVGSRFLRDLWETFPQDTLHPVVQGFNGSPSSGRFFHLNLDCPTMEDPDWVSPSTTAIANGKAGTWLRYPGNQGAATRYATKYTPTGSDSARSLHLAFNFNNIEETGERLRHIKDIVNGYFKVNACYFATAVENEPTPSPVLADVLHQNAPNPFNPETMIRYSVAQSGRAVIHVYSVGGSLVRTLVDKLHAPGSYTVRWDGRDDHGRRLASGVYFYKLETPSGSTDSKKLIMLK